MKQETVTFEKDHNYGGWLYKAGDKLILPASRAKALRSAGVLKADKPKKKDDK